MISNHQKFQGVTDSKIFNDSCINVHDAHGSVQLFMKTNNLSRIYYRVKDESFPSGAVSFHRDYNPFFGKARVAYYDFGASKLREELNTGMIRRTEKGYIVNDSLIYMIYRKPGFGF